MPVHWEHSGVATRDRKTICAFLGRAMQSHALHNLLLDVRTGLMVQMAAARGVWALIGSAACGVAVRLWLSLMVGWCWLLRAAAVVGGGHRAGCLWWSVVAALCGGRACVGCHKGVRVLMPPHARRVCVAREFERTAFRYVNAPCCRAGRCSSMKARCRLRDAHSLGT